MIAKHWTPELKDLARKVHIDWVAEIKKTNPELANAIVSSYSFSKEDYSLIQDLSLSARFEGCLTNKRVTKNLKNLEELKKDLKYGFGMGLDQCYKRLFAMLFINSMRQKCIDMGQGNKVIIVPDGVLDDNFIAMSQVTFDSMRDKNNG